MLAVPRRTRDCFARAVCSCIPDETLHKAEIRDWQTVSIYFTVRFHLDAQTQRLETRYRKEAPRIETERMDDILLLLIQMHRIQMTMLANIHLATHGLRAGRSVDNEPRSG
jgi:hypothetical protein